MKNSCCKIGYKIALRPQTKHFYIIRLITTDMGNSIKKTLTRLSIMECHGKLNPIHQKHICYLHKSNRNSLP